MTSVGVVPRPGSFAAWIVWSAGAGFVVYQSIAQALFGEVQAAIAADFSLTAAQATPLASVVPLAMVFWMLPVGLMLDRLNPRWVVAAAVAAIAAGMLVLGVAPNVAVLVAGFALIGSGSAFAFVSAGYLCRLWFSAAMFAFVFGLVDFVASALGGAAAPIAMSAALPAIGWRGLMFAGAGLGAVLVVYCLAVVRRPGVEPVGAVPAEGNPQEKGPGLWASLATVMRRPQVWAVAGVEGALLGTVFSFGTLWDLTWQQKAWAHSLYAASSMNAFVMMGFGIGTPLGGWLSDKIGRRRLPIQVGALVATAMLLVLLVGPRMPEWLADGCLLVVGLACGVTVVTYPLVCENTPARVHGLAIACVNMAGFLAVTLLSQIPGWLVAGQGGDATAPVLRWAMLVFPAVVLVAGFLNATFLVRETYCKPVVGPEA